ncbi:translocation/assembly module TamB domain-containing protein [Anabaena subtropica]|uniref:Translocation/assembly module TamB domain-containing protein n=1 Tax=Anabaena subtropica FACHB-260 TaxID=2692884 RepID=A0ABR8CPW8_9NOST|nr:translocation/assembly module TamB domain-containing protein [Anabaena subtropica]MBD2344608.1 translocation/assembly module TamB domain-containing protein [Anabaena subtropica FACHB-260]
MTRSPNNRRFSLLHLRRASLVVGIIALGGIATGTWWARNYVYTDLAPLVETNLEQLLGRSIKLGQVERFTLSSLRFSSLSIPATPTDPDSVTAQAVDVQFSPLQILFTRTLALNVTLVQPNVYIQQDQDGRWVTAEVKTEEGTGFIQTQLRTLELVDGSIELLPASAPTRPQGSVVLAQLGGVARFSPDNNRIGYEINGQLTRGGAVKISGETQLKTQQTNLQLAAQSLLASDVSRLIELPIVLQGGRVDADLAVQIPTNQSDISITGTAIPNQVTAKVPNLPQPFFNANGRLIFQDQTIALENLSTNFGQVPLVANGTVNTQTGFNLAAQVKSVSAKQLLDTLNVSSQIPTAGEVTAEIKVQGSLQQPVLTGTASNIKPIQVDRVLFTGVKTDFRLSVSETATQIAVPNLILVPAAGGQITGSGQGQLGGNVNFNILVNDVSGDILSRSYGITPPINLGNVSAKAQITGSLGQQPLALNISGIQIQPPSGGQIVGSGQVQLAPQGNVSFNIRSQNLPGDALLNTNEAIKVGNVSANTIVSGTLGNLRAVTQVQAPSATYPTTGEIVIAQQGNNIALPSAVLNVAGGTVRARGLVAQQRWQAFVNADQIQLDRFEEIPPQFQGVLSNATFNLSGSTANIQPSTIQASGQANLSVAGGIVNLRNVNLNAGRWQAVANIFQIQLDRFEEIPPQFQGVLSNATFNLSGSTDNIQPSTIKASGQANLSVAGGTVNLRNVNLNAGRWQAVANASQIQLDRFSPQLQGRLNSNIQLAGITESFQLADIRATGQISAPQGLAQLAQPITAQFQWNGQQIIVQRATTPGLSASGAIAVQLPKTGTPQIAGLNLNLQARNFDLSNTGFQTPGDVAVAGLLNFNGQVTGTLNTPIASGNIQLRNFNVGNLAFDPILTGNVNFQGGQGASLQLAGTQDKIALNLDANYRPTSFLVQRDEAVTTGRTEGDNLFINAQQFPIALVGGFVPDNQLRPLGGLLSGNLVVNLNNYAVAGDVAIANPRIARVSADEFRGNINYADGTASLNNGVLRIGESNIAVRGNLQAGNDPSFQVQANLNQTRIESLLQAFNIFDFQDLGTGLESPTLAGAEVLNTTPVSLPDADLQTQLAYFAKIAASVAQQEQIDRQQAPPLPTLEELTGALSGAITASGSLRTGLNIGFNFQGADWQWGDYSINQVVASGNFADGVVTLSPLRIGINQGLVAFAGQLGTEQLSGQLSVESLPLSLLDPFIANYPLDITGQVNAIANLTGSLSAPTVNGEVTLANATLNQQPVQTGQVNFDYNNARVNFNSTLLLTGTQPIEITGSIPAELPFVLEPPDNNQISINASVSNEGLSLLNLFTNNQVTWVDGQGQVNLNVLGTFDQPIINGNATINNATIGTQALTDPLTNVTGTLQFNGDTLNVDSIQATYNQGLVTASGILPIFAVGEPVANPLTVAIQNQLDFQVEGLYAGDVSGNAVIRGTALKPRIGGEITLSNGQVTIGNTATAPEANSSDTNIEVNTNIPATTTESIVTQDATTRPNLPVEFTDLQLSLGNNVRVTSQSLLDFFPGAEVFSQPILRFDAQGDLTINGTLANPLPEGVIRLTGGRVSLFTTEFTLERGYEHTAQFTPNQGLDPTLDVRLVTLVPEASTRTNRILESPFSAEISDAAVNNFGTLRTVRVQARATGPASQLTDNLELTSQPSRSRGEIVALLGGSILSDFAQGDATQGLTNFASSTILGGLQGTITAVGQAVGFSEFRIFPTPTTNQESRRASILDLSAEGVFNINRNLSVSLSSAFFANEPLRYNLLYRLNDEILMRGSTNLGNDSQLLLEYETRF